MASRSFNRKQALEKEVKDLYLEVSFGASGAPTIVKGVGITSITRNTTGDYTVVFNDQYFGGLKFFSGTLLKSSAEDVYFIIKAETVASTSKSLSFFSLTGGTATDPSNGSKAFFKFELKNSTVL